MRNPLAARQRIRYNTLSITPSTACAQQRCLRSQARKVRLRVLLSSIQVQYPGALKMGPIVALVLHHNRAALAATHSPVTRCDATDLEGPAALGAASLDPRLDTIRFGTLL